jgi:signal transduction histidine kinase
VLLSKDSLRGVFYAAATTTDSDAFTMIGSGEMSEHPVFMKQHECWLKNENYFTALKDEELRSYYKALFARLSIPYIPREHSVQTEYGYYFAFSEGMFYTWSEEPYPEESINILNRFKTIIDLTFRRYLDLQKAEAQAKEAQIEAALEKVRGRAMAMHKSEELAEVVAHLFEQLDNLNIRTYRCNLGIVDETAGNIQYWATTNEGKVRPVAATIPIQLNVHTKKMYNGWKEQKNIVVIKLLGEERLAWTESVRKYISFAEYQPENIDKKKILNEPAILTNFYFKQGYFAIHTLEELDSSSQNIINRFAKVFEQTYTRFLDLQRAEAQVRESRIEASLEKVRARAMSMHTPDDLSETVSLFFKELKSLNVLPWRCGVGRIDEETRTTYLTTTSITKDGEIKEVSGKLKQTGHPVLDGIFEHWKMLKEYFPVLQGDEINKYYSIIKPQIAYPDYPLDAVQYGHNIPFKEGFIFAWTENKLSEDELQIFRRFSSVLSLTYRRYMDLKEAELRAQQSIKQASLDRVRAEIASMRTSEDLNRITPVIWRELKILGVPFFRCGIYIIDEKTESVHVYLTTPDGKSLGVLNMSFNSNEITSSTVNHWRKKLVYKEHWNKQEFNNWTKYLVEQNQIPTAQSYQGSSEAPESLDLHFVPFTQGMLYVGDVQPLSDEKLELVKTLAEAFSIAYARYEDFKNLEEAKNKIETTLNELKSAQAQLIHSEKMASLGELTAGIAHEIKNPLNFVNNFSEVSRELLDEMKIELQNNKIEDVIELVENLKQNLDKINQHGKRADSIVKGMLLHSRGTSGEKTPTDINDLLDQYVNLAYHGMRATNKEFNITIEKDYDKSLEKINVVPQDISRVFLNIINNACYAANERKGRSENNFSPTLKVSTKNINSYVEIRIRDNGDGIPNVAKEQIFKPFFTTKPTGEGTGLGLSISYDIVTKVHGGDIRIESEEGKGAEFIITLPK